MNSRDLFRKYRRRLACIGAVKALTVSAIAGFCLAGVMALVTWLAAASLPVVLVLSVGLCAAAVAAGTPVLYLRRFRPTAADVAARLDELGLDERMITMCEQEGSDSRLAALQREDAAAHLRGISARQLRFSVALPVLLLLLCSFLFAASFTTVSALAAEGMLGRGETAEEEQLPDEETELFYTVRYLIREEGTGTLEGETVQTVKKGGYTEAVRAIPAKGYVFDGWRDAEMNRIGSQNAVRVDLNVRGDMEIFAWFTKADDAGGEDPEEPPVDGEISGGKEDGSDGDKEEIPDSGEDSDSDVKGDESEGNTGHGRENNHVIDGKQDYREEFDREEREKELADDRTLPDELKDLLGDYFGSLKP